MAALTFIAFFVTFFSIFALFYKYALSCNFSVLPDVSNIELSVWILPCYLHQCALLRSRLWNQSLYSKCAWDWTVRQAGATESGDNSGGQLYDDMQNVCGSGHQSTL
ncbi:hypothetical protein AVEN_212100-1 [Araneus ventricosus]|uniref:Uncharacterized protein n=1 Tax=Araneus ventricosus TaxID=182803 RepID=A0A4Y2UJZ9_ARAVE|nr:hypothetical protein AVEN_212100-1 [Araneus ventricosus]